MVKLNGKTVMETQADVNTKARLTRQNISVLLTLLTSIKTILRQSLSFFSSL